VVKQILLGVAVVGGEVFLDECTQLLGGGIAAGEWFSASKLENALVGQPEIFSPSLRMIWARLNEYPGSNPWAGTA